MDEEYLNDIRRSKDERNDKTRLNDECNNILNLLKDFIIKMRERDSISYIKSKKVDKHKRKG